VKKVLFVLSLIVFSYSASAQTVAQMKKVLDTTNNPIGFVKYILKKKYHIDTIAVLSTQSFLGIADSLAYNGKVGKTYGPFKKENILVKILVKAPNTFYHVKHIVLDTAHYTVSFAEKLADSLIAKLKDGRTNFADAASTYSADHESAIRGGDLGWFVKGVMLKQLDAEMVKHKKGEVFKVWTDAGLHIVMVPDDPKQDTGYALLLRVIL
jgi:hypothetical protein